MDRSVERAARNEIVFRRVNNEIERERDRIGAMAERTPYICECEQERCTVIVRLSRDEYRQVRSSPRRFVVSAGHESEGNVLVMDAGEFRVIEKTGREGDLVEREHPPA